MSMAAETGYGGRFSPYLAAPPTLELAALSFLDSASLPSWILLTLPPWIPLTLHPGYWATPTGAVALATAPDRRLPWNA